MAENAQAVCLIKPQFEAGKENVGKKGVVRDKAVHKAVIEKILGIAQNEGYRILGLDFSPVKGPEGNIEYLCYIEKSGERGCAEGISPENVVENSHSALDRVKEENL